MTWLLIQLIILYQRYISLDHGLLGRIVPHRGPVCRFQPTCSEYMKESLERYGMVKGGWLGLRRLGRCHPWGSFGPDPVPNLPTRP